MQSEDWEKLLARSIDEVRRLQHGKALQTLIRRAEALLWHLEQERNERKRQEHLARIIAEDEE